MRKGWNAISGLVGGVSPNTLRRWMKEEGFPVTFVGRIPVVSERLVTEWLEKRVKKKVSAIERNRTH